LTRDAIAKVKMVCRATTLLQSIGCVAMKIGRKSILNIDCQAVC
jgi:hypothetical protein